ncbi:MAG: hypothetical protein K9L82_15890 [Chromatiaceae bacterium]|nr:hypothetical protein [Chromatiaceae bacterium]MCF8015135.1 hypothetical protein [Chromatiaceae bacterium]
MTPRLVLTPYRLPLRRPWRSAHGLRREREGWLVQAYGQGCCGYGDCAPLPEAGTETSIAAAKRLSTWLHDHGQSALETQLALLEQGIPSATPAADAALETALLDLSARLCGLPLHEHLVGIGERQYALSTLAELHPRLKPSLRPSFMLNQSRLETKLRLRAGQDRQPELNPEQKSDSALAPDLAQEEPELKLDPIEPKLESGMDQEHALKPRAEIAINAALGAVSDLQPEQLDRVLAAGFRVLKVKMGVAPISCEQEVIWRLSAQLPTGVRLRLDANRAWSLATTRKLVDDLLPISSQIECLEEPCADASDAELYALQEQTPFALALDESLPARGWPLDPDQLPLRRLVLKPGVIGGLRPTLALAWRAQAVGLEVVITSLIESAAGLWSSAQLAVATGSTLAHGLATADWFAADLGPAPTIKAGRIQLPNCPGSGFVHADASAKRDRSRR